jgi:hypothetical protein
VAGYIYNHVTEDWDPITPESVNEVTELVTFKTQVLGLFQASVGDLDADGILDSTDNCQGTPNPGQVNSDGDSLGDACDNCPAFDNEDQADIDGDNVGNLCDNCLDQSNPNQADNYPPQGNGIGDACDCEGDFNCDGNVDATDVTKFLEDFGRNQFNNACPACVVGNWCSY